MTTGTSPDAGAAARRWAAELLGVPENASAGEARRAYLRKVRESDFVPPRSLYRAFRILEGEGAPAPLDEEWLVEEESRLRAEVEAFAEAFFALPVTLRRQRWEALRSGCQRVPPLLARLQDLKAGLEVESLSLPADESLSGRLAEHLLQSFPLPPLARAASRQAFLRRIEEPAAAADHKAWEKAACYLRAEWPGLAALDKELVQQIAGLRGHLKRRGKMHQRNRQKRPAARAGGGTGNPWWVLVLIGLGLSGFLRGMTSSDNSSSRGTPWVREVAPYDGARFNALENQGGRVVTDPKTGAKSIEIVAKDVPPIPELLDPSKFDVEIVNPVGVRLLRFTPRPGSTITGRNGPQPNNGPPVLLREVALGVMGASQQQVNELLSRAAARLPDGAEKEPPEEVGPGSAKSSQRDKARP